MIKNKILKGIVVMVVFMLSCSQDDEEDQLSCPQENLEIEITDRIAASCEEANGAFRVESSHQARFSLNGGEFQEEEKFENLQAGEYTLVVQLNEDCEKAYKVEIPSESGLSSNISVRASGCEEANGRIELETEGGTPPYQYSLDGSDFSDESIFETLVASEYNVTIKDENECEISYAVTVTSGVSLSEDIMSIIENNCSVNGCHNGNQDPDLRTTTTVRNYALQIKEQTQSGNMPQGGTLPPAQIEAIACWVDDGAEDN